jgi:hypothetical protein
MVLFDYKQLSFFAKFAREIWIGGLILAAAVLIVSLICIFKKKYYARSAFKKFFYYFSRIFLAVAVSVVIVIGFSHIKNRHALINEAYEKYTDMYESGKCKTVIGKVEDFTPYTHSKSFTVDGVYFKIYSNKSINDSKDPSEKAPPIYYYYTEAYTTFHAFTSGDHTNTDSRYVPEKCVILGENQPLEIHYVEEFGQNRILYIKELEQ